MVSHYPQRRTTHQPRAFIRDKSFHSYNLLFLSATIVAGELAEIECADNKKRRLGITPTTVLFCCGSERTLHGETAAEEIGVRPIPVWWSSPIKIRTQRRFDLVKRNCLRPMLIVVGQDQFIIEHIHGVYKCINQAFLKITVCWIAMTELLKPCRHLFAGQLWLLPSREHGGSSTCVPAHG